MMEAYGALEDAMKNCPSRLFCFVPELLEEVVGPVVIAVVEEKDCKLEADGLIGCPRPVTGETMPCDDGSDNPAMGEAVTARRR